ncbi:hypothetical protein ACIBG8_41580 [Nonomuraea sp. NPDC050556]|uniref:hypothetical protein n=1 Tax=Nonomuraea sp. NPDC050556 TaxID=3364369 RepID=UPI0037943AB3
MFGRPPRSAGRFGWLIRQARKAGRVSGKSGKFDEWSLADGLEVPYMTMLDEQRKEALSRRGAQYIEDREGLRAANATHHREVAASSHEIALAQERITSAGAFMDRALVQMDRVAAREAAVQDDLDSGRRAKRAKGEPERPADLPADAVSGSGVSIVHPDLTSSDPEVGEPKWEGPLGKQMSARLKYALLGLLVMVEVPVQLKIFEFFEPIWWRAAIFAFPVAAVMCFLPHMSGVLYRRRRATGADGLGWVLGLVALGPWIALAILLGDLRRRVLMPMAATASKVSGAEAVNPLRGRSRHTTIEQLGLTPVTVSVMFAMLLLLAGALAFLLGIAEDHPMVSAYRGAAERQREEADRLRAGRTGAETAQRQIDEFDEKVESQRERHEHLSAEINSAYAAAAAAYTDAVTEVVARPAVTEAASIPDASRRTR